MARTTTSLNPTQVEKAKPREKEYNLSDGKGLQLRVKPNGSKLWLFNYYHPHTKKRKNLSLGPYPDLTLAKAREQRDKYRTLLADEIDPIDYREQERTTSAEKAAATFITVAEQWLVIHATKVTPGTIANIRRSLEKDVYPLVGKYPIEQIRAPKAIEVINSIVGRNSYEIARKVSRRMNSVMTFAVNSGIIAHNPIAGIREVIPSSKVAHRAALPPEELPTLMKAIRYSSAKISTRCLIEFQLHTMVRPGEAAEAEWSEIDEEKGIWTIPAARMKMARDHIVPLTSQVIEILETMKPLSAHRKYVFPSSIDPKKSANRQTANKALRDMGFTGKQTAHGLRSLASTTLNEQAFDHDVIETALAHRDESEVRSAYNRAQYLERRKVMMCWWSEHIENSLAGKESKSTSNILSIKTG